MIASSYDFTLPAQDGGTVNQVEDILTKFLVDRRGESVHRLAPTTAPVALTRNIEILLG